VILHQYFENPILRNWLAPVDIDRFGLPAVTPLSFGAVPHAAEYDRVLPAVGRVESARAWLGSAATPVLATAAAGPHFWPGPSRSRKRLS